MFTLLILILVGLGLWYVIQKLKELEVEIRRDIEKKNQSSELEEEQMEVGSVVETRPVASQQGAVQVSPPVSVKTDRDQPLSIRERILVLISAAPGLVQTELYEQLTDSSKKQLQQMLLKLEREGVIRREKQGGSYRLYPG